MKKPLTLNLLETYINPLHQVEDINTFHHIGRFWQKLVTLCLFPKDLFSNPLPLESQVSSKIWSPPWPNFSPPPPHLKKISHPFPITPCPYPRNIFGVVNCMSDRLIKIYAQYLRNPRNTLKYGKRALELASVRFVSIFWASGESLALTEMLPFLG